MPESRELPVTGVSHPTFAPSDTLCIRRIEPIARNQNTFAKRQREMEKKEKAEAKQVRRNQRKEAAPESGASQSQGGAPIEASPIEHDADK